MLSSTLGTTVYAPNKLSAIIADILKSSTFFAPLTHSLALTRGTGSPTYTRATAATVFDNEGKLITVPSGASRHVGARYVRNLFSSTATLTSGSSATVSSLAAGTYTFSMGAGTGTATLSGTGGATGTLTASASGRVEVTKTITAGTFVVTASVATLVDIQLENVTGQADQTASEYVSVGVLSAPYHGLGVDGIKAFDTHKSGAPIAASSLEGYLSEPAATNNLLYCRDLTQAAAWTASNVTPAKTATGIDGAANAASTLTASANDATILQQRTLASAARSSSAYIKRRTGTGNVYFTRDGGTTWTDITASLSTSAWYRAKIENSSVTNPSVGFKLATSGDAIDVDYVQDEVGAQATSPIATTTATVTRNADYLVYPNTGNVTDAAATAYAKHKLLTTTPVSRKSVSFSANNNNRAQIHIDQGTGYFVGYFGTGSGIDFTTPGVVIKAGQNIAAIAWTNGSKGKSCVNGGNVNKTTSNVAVVTSAIAIGASVGGGQEGAIVRDVHVFASELTDAQLKAITR